MRLIQSWSESDPELIGSLSTTAPIFLRTHLWTEHQSHTLELIIVDQTRGGIDVVRKRLKVDGGGRDLLLGSVVPVRQVTTRRKVQTHDAVVRLQEGRGGEGWRGVVWRGVAWCGVPWRGSGGVGWGGVSPMTRSCGSRGGGDESGTKGVGQRSGVGEGGGSG